MSNETLTLELTEEGSGSQVYFKEDGGRFSESQTLKLTIDSKYCISLLCKTSLTTDEILINGDSILLLSTYDKDTETHVYKGGFSTDQITKTAKDKRDVITLQLPVRPSVLVPLQCKYYKKTKKSSSSWGDALKNIIVSYKVEDGVEGLKTVLEGVRMRRNVRK